MIMLLNLGLSIIYRIYVEYIIGDVYQHLRTYVCLHYFRDVTIREFKVDMLFTY